MVNYDERNLRRRANARIRMTVGRIVWRRVLPVIALAGWVVIMSAPTHHATLHLGASLTYLHMTPPLKILATLLLLGLFGWVIWSERCEYLRRLRRESKACRKAKRASHGRLALNDDGELADPLEDVIWQGEEKPKRFSGEE